MRITLSGDNLSDLAKATARSRVTVSVEFEVESIDAMGDSLTVSGTVCDCNVQNVRASDGQNLEVVSALDGLKRMMPYRTSGTMA